MSTFTPDQIRLAAQNMEQYGGGFASALAVAMARADSHNLQRIVAAFPDLIERYSVIHYTQEQA